MRDDFKNYSIDDFRKFEGTEWKHGTSDCYNLIQRVYNEMFHITLRDYERQDKWWEHPELFDLYRKHYEEEGFHKIEINKNNHLQLGDALLMDLHCGVPAHAALYIGNDYILHHLPGKLSNIEPYIGLWVNATVEIIRHKDMD